MRSIKVREVMVPLAGYATVSEDATLYDAVVALREACRDLGEHRDRHRSVLVYGKHRRIVGQVTYWDVCRGLEPKYAAMGNLRETSRYGFSPDFLRSMLDTYGLWRKPLDDLCSKAADLKVKDIMNTPSEGQYVKEDASLDEAIHQLVMGHHQSLLVTRDEEIVGILRLSDVFKEIGDRVMSCKLNPPT